MSSTIHYRNTDLDVVSPDDPEPLMAYLGSRGVSPLHVEREADGLWYGTFETDEPFEEAEPNLSALLTILESLPAAARTGWQGCTARVFDLGYDCGDNPWSFIDAISANTLRRMADVGVSLKITLYRPDPTDEQAPPGA